MDEEENQWNFDFGEPSSSLIRKESCDLVQEQQSPENNHNNFQYQQIKAVNPYQAAQNLPEKQRQAYLYMIEHGKFHPGLFHIFEQEKQQEYPGIDEMNDYMIAEPEQQPFCLNSLFQPKNHDETHQLQKLNFQLKSKWDHIHEKYYEICNPRKCTTSNFFSRFDNFAYLNGQQNFLKDLEISLIAFIESAKKIQGPSMQLITEMYEFWMKMFRSLILEIFKFSEKFTLDFMKKKKGTESNSNYDNHSSSNIEVKSGNSSRMNQLDRRRPWKTTEIQILEKYINQDTVFSTALINHLAEQFNRSPASISSKIQKITKFKNNQNPDFIVDDNTTLFDRINAILKIYPEGLSRENIIDRINEHYEMGVDDSWNKSVAQILSSRPQFVKVKGVYSLTGEQVFDLSKKTFKDKVVNCLLKCPNGKGDLKKLVEIYIELYGKIQGASIQSDKRKRQIQASFSKALSRYPIFNKSQSKTVYKLRQFCQPQDFDIQIQSYLS